MADEQKKEPSKYVCMEQPEESAEVRGTDSYPMPVYIRAEKNYSDKWQFYPARSNGDNQYSICVAELYVKVPLVPQKMLVAKTVAAMREALTAERAKHYQEEQQMQQDIDKLLALEAPKSDSGGTLVED